MCSLEIAGWPAVSWSLMVLYRRMGVQYMTPKPSTKIKRICEVCKTEFYVCPSVITNGRGKTCSRVCKDKWHSTHIRGKNHPLWKDKVKIKCAYCGKTKEVFPDQARAKKFLFCDTKCQAEWQRENRSKENHPCWKGGGVKVNCSNCSAIKTVEQWAIQRSQNFFCDIDCRAEWMSKNMRGSNNPCWNGRTSFAPYSLEFNDELKQKIRERDQYTCIVCGSEGKLVHHIDYDKNNNRENNLVTVCRSCHGKTNFNRKSWLLLFRTWKAKRPVHDPK